MNESKLDDYIISLLNEAGIIFERQGTEIKDLADALKNASKNQTGEIGKPDFICVVNDFVLVMEDKADRDKLFLKDNDGNFSMSINATKNYALNGAIFYAKKILEHDKAKKIFAFGNAGDSKHHTLKPVFVALDGVKELEEVETFTNFSAINIENYYRQVVKGEELPEQLKRTEIRSKAEKLHEHLRNFGQLGETEKPLVVAAILLALNERGFSLEQLDGDTVKTDGEKLYERLEANLKRAQVRPEVKLKRVLNQFTLIKDRPNLNTPRKDLDGTPLRYFTKYIRDEIYNAIKIGNSPDDYLGMFYSEFVRYSGGDGQSLGVVLTPSHITELFCDLVNLTPDDVIFDPCCGTGGFLIAGMHKMLNAAKDNTTRTHIKAKQIYGIELRDDMFSIATTNMILRGDGQSNLTCEDFLAKSPDDLQLLGITKGFMNPPYSQAKNAETASLSELNFVYHLLESVNRGGKVAVIVPVSAMIGKTKDDRQRKADILKHHTLEGVISLNKNTFYGVGTVPCIAVFTTGEPHQPEKLSKFINFEDDGFELKKHQGYIETERAKDRKKYLLDCWNEIRTDYPSSFMVETTITASDEWLHSFYYYNDELPSEKDFVNSIADYLTFEANMIFHGRGYLFGFDDGTRGGESFSLEGRKWGKFALSEIFDIKPTVDGIDKIKLSPGDGVHPYITRSDINNGINSFVCRQNYKINKGNCITVGLDTQTAFYQPKDFYTGQNVQILRSEKLNAHNAKFFLPAIKKTLSIFSWGGNGATLTRLRRSKIFLPIDNEGRPDFAFMENFMREHEKILAVKYAPRVSENDGEKLSLDGVRWGKFFISDVAEIISGRGIFEDERQPGATPYITASAVNNGVSFFLSNTNETLEADCISVNSNGSVGFAFYHPYAALYSGDCRKLRLKHRGKHAAIFIATQITAQKNKYSYGYKMGTARLKRQKILLPIDAQGQPDYFFMEKFIRQHERELICEYVSQVSAKIRNPPPEIT